MDSGDKTKFVLKKCLRCHGSGWGWVGNAYCPSCKGRGRVWVMKPASKCPACHGSGSGITGNALCGACGGSGWSFTRYEDRPAPAVKQA